MTAPTIDDRAARVVFGDRRPRRRRLVRALLIFVGALVLGLAVWVVFFSSILAVSGVRVVGADGVQADQVIAAAAVPIGTPLARLDTSGAQAAVLALPWVSGVEVRRGWPNEVVLAVTVRQAIASLQGSRSAVDSTGAVFETVGALPSGLPVVSAHGAGLEAAMAVLVSLPADLAQKVVTISSTTRDDVVLNFRSGAIVRWGSADQPQFKAEVLRALLRHKRDVYDVTAPELPTTFRKNR